MTTAVTTYQQKVNTVRALLEKSRNQIAMALPRHLTPERMIRVALTAYQRVPELLECDPTSIVGCVIQASQLGLELDGILGHAYMIPFWNGRRSLMEAQFVVGYRGYLALARRSGEVSVFTAKIAHANEHFDWIEGSEGRIIHKPLLKDRGEPVAAYAVLRLKDGGGDSFVMPWDEVLACQQEYGHYKSGKKKGQRKEGPWWNNLPEMARKTCVRRLAKYCPVSVEIQRAAALDERADAELPQDLGVLAELTSTEQLEARLAAGVNPVPEPDAVKSE